MINAAELHDYLSLDEETGKLFWKPRRGLASTLWGKEAFTSTRPDGYKQGTIKGQKLFGHRVVFALAFGDWPTGSIDHINGNKVDNRPSNLRDVSHAENCRNLPRPSTNTSGHIGVTWIRRLGKWGAQIKVKQEVKWLGCFATKDAAIAARKSAEALFGFHPNHGARNA